MERSLDVLLFIGQLRVVCKDRYSTYSFDRGRCKFNIRHIFKLRVLSSSLQVSIASPIADRYAAGRWGSESLLSTTVIDDSRLTGRYEGSLRVS